MLISASAIHPKQSTLVFMATRSSINPIHITPSPKELREGKLLPQNIERALYALNFDGLVVLENVIDHAHLNVLNEAMLTDTPYLASLGEESPYNYHKGTSKDYIYKLQGIYNRIRRPVKTFSFATFS